MSPFTINIFLHEFFLTFSTKVVLLLVSSSDCSLREICLEDYYLCYIYHFINEILSLPASYGSTLRNKTVDRIQPVGKHSLIGASGDISDFQEILRKLNELM